MENKRIHIQIKGSQNHENTQDLMAEFAFENGLKGYSKNSGSDVLELIAEGEKSKLFDLIKRLTTTKFQDSVDEIIFFFKEVETPSLRVV